MISAPRILGALLILSISASAAPKSHIVTFGKWITISWRSQRNEFETVSLKIRPLLVDGRTREFALGNPHEITEHTFAVQRIYRLNDSLPQDSGPPRWQWERGGWLLVDRASGKIQQITLPQFDPDLSLVSWYRDYAAYCGISDDGQKAFAVVVQLGHRKPLLAKVIEDASGVARPLAAPHWERDPTRAIFELGSNQQLMFSIIRSRTAELASQDHTPQDEDDEDSQ